MVSVLQTHFHLNGLNMVAVPHPATSATSVSAPHYADCRTEEVESESISYSVCQYYGFETGANTFGYIDEINLHPAADDAAIIADYIAGRMNNLTEQEQARKWSEAEFPLNGGPLGEVADWVRHDPNYHWLSRGRRRCGFPFYSHFAKMPVKRRLPGQNPPIINLCS